MKRNLYRTLVEIRRNYYKRRIISYYKNTEDLEIKEIVETIKRNNELNVFNYDFADKYAEMDVEIEYDDKSEMYYILENGRPLYFKRDMKPDEILEYYKGISMEQDMESPHRYLAENGIKITEGDVIIDLGGGRRELYI